jgi:DNA-binding NarL/FixJ family response regulator
VPFDGSSCSESFRRRRNSFLPQDDKEREVLELMLLGTSNKAMASKLDVSLRTIENRRRKVFSKLRVETVAELVALVLKARNRPTGQTASRNLS